MSKTNNIPYSEGRFDPFKKSPHLKIFYEERINSTRDLLPLLQGASLKNPHLKWKARPILEADLAALYDKIFGNPNTMRTYESGIPLPRKELDRRFQIWNRDLHSGAPKGAFLITDEQDECIGYVLIAETDRPGIARIAHAYDLNYASQGIATSVINCFIEKWAPQVSLLGRQAAQFRCFQGASLQKFYGYIRPSNPGAWIAVDRLGFQRAKVTNLTEKKNVILNYYNPNISRSNKAEFLQKLLEMENHILEYFKKNMDLEKDEKILMIDLEGNERTVSYMKEFQNIWWHFEYPIS